MADRAPSPPVAMSANVSGPLDPHEFYASSFESSPLADTAPPLPKIQTSGPVNPNKTRSGSQLPAPRQTRAASGPPDPSQHALNSGKSNPAPAVGQLGSVKDIANKFDQGTVASTGPPPLTNRTSQERFRKPPAAKGARLRSPVTAPGKSDSNMARLQKRRPGQPKSPERSPATSVETSTSFSSNATIISTRSQPHAALSPRKQPVHPKSGPYISARPLFGELTADGHWHANFDMSGHGSLPNVQTTSRRMSEGNAAPGHVRSHSHQDMSSPHLSPRSKQTLHHKRSRSEMDVVQPQQAPSLPNLISQTTPALYPTPPNSGTRNTLRSESPVSRIPVSSQRQSEDSARAPGPHSRSASAMSTHAGRNTLSKSPIRIRQTAGKENHSPTANPRGRYQPPPIATNQDHQVLSAKIVAPLPKTSPLLRSSRPRQPVSSATTSASRARAAERLQKSAAKDGRKPSEQWMGKSYDPQKERTKRKIPELEKVDFAERRARIQKAISRNLEQQWSRDSLKSEPGKIQAQQEGLASAGAESEAQNSVDQRQAEEMDRETTAMLEGDPGLRKENTRGLSLDTVIAGNSKSIEAEPRTADTVRTTGTAGTDFELDESPVTGRPTMTAAGDAVQPSEEPPVLLTPATYQPPPVIARVPPRVEITQECPDEEVQSPTMLESVMRMRGRSASSAASRGDTGFVADSPSAEDSPSDLGDRWGLAHSVVGDQGSIRIMLDDDSEFNQQAQSWSKNAHHDFPNNRDFVAGPAVEAQAYDQDAYAANEYTESPIDGQETFPEETLQDTPRKHETREETLKPDSFQPTVAFAASSESLTSNEAIARALGQYQAMGMISPEMLQAIQGHMVDFNRVSANGGSDAIMVQNLLDSIADSRQAEIDTQTDQVVEVDRYGIPIVTPDTPPDAALAAGSAVVFADWPDYDDTTADDAEEEEEDFQEKIRKADEEWERQQRGEDTVLGADDEDRPAPPPKDVGYTLHSSIGPNSATFALSFTDGLQISSSGQADSPEVHPVGELAEDMPVDDRINSPMAAPPLPSYAPPPPPSPSGLRLPYGMPEAPQMPASYSERESSELSPRLRKNLWGPSGSSRPSTDSQRPPPPIPASQSISSFADSTRQNSIDTGADSAIKVTKPQSPGPEQKRLLKRRHIIKELLDTENNYHQDLKIIEDIYKATVADLVTPEDRKTLFGNCDDIERFSLHFYDELRKSVAPIYVPPKQMRWAGQGQKRGSYSTTQSDGAGPTSTLSSDSLDEEKDRATTIGKCFQDNLHRMDQVYGCYLKNHEAANHRLAALKNTPTVKCWLDECHNNASDITSAWDLDSLLVKPTQRVSKYPMLLQQLLETTPADHPDHEALKAAGKDTINMLTRINEAKKRADIVDQIINHKGKDSDMRSGIAKAFGRRTERLKERVGIAEAFQDPEFDELAYKFGGHFIRLQICMRDVQDYMHRIDKSMDQIIYCATALDGFTDVWPSSLPEIESKWRKYGQVVRDIGGIAFPEHKAAVHKRVIQPMVTCIKLHDGPQNAINKRKRMIVDYAKCKSIERRGEKPDRKTVDASEKYEALNHQLKLELPKLYSFTSTLVQRCLDCFLDIQLTWYDTWQRKLRPMLEVADFPESIEAIEPAFRPDHELVKDRLAELGLCNGALLADSANFLSPTSTLVGDSEQSSLKRPATLDSSRRTLSVGSEGTSALPHLHKRHSSGYGARCDVLQPSPDARVRSNSSLSTRGTSSQTPASVLSANRAWTNTSTPNSSFTPSRPTTANPPSAPQQPIFQYARGSVDDVRSPRPSSGQTYFTARPEQPEDQRFSGIFSSAMPSATDTPDSTRPASRQELPPPPCAAEDVPVLFVCASLFEFSIDKTRKEGGYPYLTYVQGEVFDVIAQKGELWLAKNQDDASNSLGWIWEQHFVTLSHE